MDELEELRSLVGWLLLEVFVLVFHRFWVVHFGGKLCRIFGRNSSKVGPAGPPRIPGWSLGRVLSTWYQSIRLFDSATCYTQ